MYRERDIEPLCDFRRLSDAAGPGEYWRRTTYPHPPRRAIGERAPGPADTDPARGDRASRRV